MRRDVSGLAAMLHSLSRMRSRRVVFFAFACWSVWVWTYRRATASAALPGPPDASTYETSFPLAWQHIHSFNGTGGAWYIPDEWLAEANQPQPRTILDAARLAAKVAESNPARQMDHGLVPLLVHQTWATARVDAWTPQVLRCVERWLAYATGRLGDHRGRRGPPMAYFFWDDEGVLSFMRAYEPDFVDAFLLYFTPVERADIFRILVCKWLGGIYGDIDTEPLRHPATWIHLDDLVTWRDPKTGAYYGREETTGEDGTDTDLWDPPRDDERPVRLLVGLEADTDPSSDTYWRMGYSYPVQLTQWALASAPQHPILSHFMDGVRKEVEALVQFAKGGASPAAVAAKTRQADPLTRTGPGAITAAASTWLADNVGLRWNAVTGLHDGGKAKLVRDVLVLPITGFSPGRGRYGNMGSKPATDKDARLLHHAQGSWRRFDLRVELGKLCRTTLGMCRDWSKVPS